MKSDTRIKGITVNFYKSALIFKKKGTPTTRRCQVLAAMKRLLPPFYVPILVDLQGRKVSAELHVLKEEKEGQAKFFACKFQEHYKQYTELFQLRVFQILEPTAEGGKTEICQPFLHLKVGVNCCQKERGNIVLLIARDVRN